MLRRNPTRPFVAFRNAVLLSIIAFIWGVALLRLWGNGVLQWTAVVIALIVFAFLYLLSIRVRNIALQFPIVRLLMNRMLLLVVIGMMIMSGISLVIEARSSTSPPVTARLGHVAFFLLRLPETDAGYYQITVYNSIDTRYPRHAFREFVQRTPSVSVDIHETQLAQAQWQTINDVRTRWCQESPQFRAMRTNEMGYDVGIYCELSKRKSFRIPEDSLPSELRRLIAVFD
ncbi:MAG: hypothetical protein MI924_27140 [Chloroflexales bacterium]|nr:hypothetical protein [Chloroflexales bacterium]